MWFFGCSSCYGSIIATMKYANAVLSLMDNVATNNTALDRRRPTIRMMAPNAEMILIFLFLMIF